MGIYIEQKSLSPTSKLMTLRCRNYNFLGSLLHEKDIKIIAKKPIELSFKEVAKEVFSNVDKWKETKTGHTYKIDDTKTAFIYDKGKVPKGGRPKKQPIEETEFEEIEVIDETEVEEIEN